MTDLSNGALDALVSDLTHTGEISMLYRCEIADTINSLRREISNLRHNIQAQGGIEEVEGKGLSRTRQMAKLARRITKQRQRIAQLEAENTALRQQVAAARDAITGLEMAAAFRDMTDAPTHWPDPLTSNMALAGGSDGKKG